MEFTYNASACAAGGVIQKKNRDWVVIPSLASVALAPTGGEGVTIERNYQSEAVSFSYAETRVFGREVSTDLFTTQTDVYITNLRIFDVLSIAMLRATVTSSRKVDRDPNRPPDDDHAFELDASYHGVEVRGSNGRSEIEPKIDVCVKSLKRYKHLGDLLSGQSVAQDGTALIPPTDKGMLYRRFNTRFDPNPRKKDRLKEAFAKQEALLGSLVEDVEADDRRLEATGARKHPKLHKVYIPKFGTVRFGELMLKPGRRRVNLLRIQLVDDEVSPLLMGDAPVNEGTVQDDYRSGSLAVGAVEGNGRPLYP